MFIGECVCPTTIIDSLSVSMIVYARCENPARIKGVQELTESERIVI
jgi:hypothetical protein